MSRFSELKAIGTACRRFSNSPITRDQVPSTRGGVPRAPIGGEEDHAIGSMSALRYPDRRNRLNLPIMRHRALAQLVGRTPQGPVPGENPARIGRRWHTWLCSDRDGLGAKTVDSQTTEFSRQSTGYGRSSGADHHPTQPMHARAAQRLDI